MYSTRSCLLCLLFNYTVLPSWLIVTELTILYQDEYAQMAALLEPGITAKFLQPVIALEFPLSSAAEAHHEVMEHKQGSCGKIILTV